MKPFRLERLEKELLRIINNAIIYKVRDQRLKEVSVTDVKLSPDQQFARIFFSTLEDDVNLEHIIALLTKASGFIKKEIADTKILRKIPDLRFVYDDTENKAREIESIIEKIKE